MRFKPNGDHHGHVRCLAPEESDSGITAKCTLSQLEDKFKFTSGHDKHHKCSFKLTTPDSQRQRTLHGLRLHFRFDDQMGISSVLQDFATFVRRVNISINAVFHGDLHPFLAATSKLLLRSGFHNIHPR
jgi:hypothetical protein